jgi:hypothetical protein
MSWSLQTIAQTRVGDFPEDTVMISGSLHGPHRCTCQACLQLETVAAEISELLRPGERREIVSPIDNRLFLVVRRHKFSPRARTRVRAPNNIRSATQLGNTVAVRGDFTNLKAEKVTGGYCVR